MAEQERKDETVLSSPEDSNKREDAKDALYRVVITALRNCSDEAKLDPTSYPIIAQTIMDQLTQPHVGWALKELSRPLRSY